MKNISKSFAIGIAALALTAVAATAYARAVTPAVPGSIESASEANPAAAEEITVQLKITGMT